MKSSKLCECGCGEFTTVIPKNNTARGWVKGEPRRFLSGHASRKWPHAGPNPSGLCFCGCGETTPLGRTRKPPLIVPDEHVRYVRGHANRKSPDAYVVDSAGCWVWQLGLNSQGYGGVRRDGRQLVAHRLYYVERFGPLADDVELHHRCENRRCVNPDHLVPLSKAEHAALHGALRHAA